MVTHSSNLDHHPVEDGFSGILNILNSNCNWCVVVISQALEKSRIHLMEGYVPKG